MNKYSLEFILHTHKTSKEAVRSSLSEFAENIEIVDCLDPDIRGKHFKINISTQDPTVIFDICSQFGRIKSIKVDEVL